jgi:UDP-GlcNAc:undecaprenyl-phosphate/decaprenyl-phosphate GlcNAc-1-phosphate transferase
MRLYPYLVAGLVAFAITYVTTPIVRYVMLRAGVIDHPSDRKVHARPTPTLGGAAIFLGVVGAGAAAYFMPDFRQVFTLTSETLGIATAGVVIFALGAVDDLRNLPAPVKLAGQIFASGILFLSGVKMQFVLLPREIISLGDDVSVLVTVLWLVAMINAVNLVDGLDGLAAGIVAIASACFFVYTFELGRENLLGPAPTAPLAAIVLVGVTLGFLRHNFYPARIFMGDSGAMFLGLLLGATTIVAVGNKPLQGGSSSDFFLAYFPLLIPLMVLALPLLDTCFAIVRRARQRRAVWQADKQHIHHRLMDLGHGHRQAVIVMYVWSALAAGAGLAFTLLDRASLVFALPIAVGAIVLYTLFPLLTKLLRERLTL